MTVAPLTTLIGIAANSVTADGLEFSATLYSRFPMRAMPAGTKMFEFCTAVTTSAAESPLAESRAGFTSIVISRVLPPYGAGVESPGIVKSCRRRKFWP